MRAEDKEAMLEAQKVRDLEDRLAAAEEALNEMIVAHEDGCLACELAGGYAKSYSAQSCRHSWIDADSPCPLCAVTNV